jgi:hypothetical protein
MRCTKKPAFDGIVFFSTKNFKDKFMRQDANEILESTAMYIPRSHAVRALTDKGVGHEDAPERAEMEWLYTTIVTMSGACTVRVPQQIEHFDREFFSAAAKLLVLEDKNLQTRYHAQELVKFLTTEGEDVESVVCNEVASNTRRITKTQ